MGKNPGSLTGNVEEEEEYTIRALQGLLKVVPLVKRVTVYMLGDRKFM
jgi:hypothetical protein